MTDKPTIAILGGTGDLGSGLAKCWLAAGYKVVLGSRSAEKAKSVAEAMTGEVAGDDNVGAARAGDIVVLAVPFASHDATLTEVKDVVQGKIVVDAAVPLVPPKVSVVQLPSAGSAAQIAQQLLGPGVRVVSAFHNVGATKLHQGGRADCDVLVFGDDKAARDIVISLANEVASAGIDGGVLANSAAAEALTSVLIGINRRYKVPGAGIRITGLTAKSVA
ncbi:MULTISPECIES: NADPH-dependent F420 reductase [Bradyrhizobium]|jgi:NADPH-dependent F420 reductase|uniref:NADPH-dependent F420 reductase n=1 Tax=Bradyrhizobium TaxID=374 RepID=UPI00040ABDC4|nr:MULTISPECIES: NADPH-dependent F420 reductase [Bradyrhizobium]AUC96303.1 NADPH-dependent F420 reductase [Bradyrhizobium sp. SK17]KIU45512.1 F420-dependent NADP reductase [Bradyrhizobium elkanii]MBK5653231.1 NADPH-dependent F420 reductase [Rhizobium sp.]OCX30471.1 NADPH-dependent F420 reductase [Bradyrhizobium sp. UASWS1016]